MDGGSVIENRETLIRYHSQQLDNSRSSLKRTILEKLLCQFLQDSTNQKLKHFDYSERREFANCVLK